VETKLHAPADLSNHRTGKPEWLHDVLPGRSWALGVGARAVDGGPGGGVGKLAEAGWRGGVMDLAGKYVVVWLSPEAI
jgi:hypothetical protein